MTVGIYVENNDNPFANEVKKYLVSLIQSYPTILQMHGFYYDEKMSLINFDLVISFDDKKPEETIENIKSALEAKYKKITFIIQHDQDYSLS